MAKPYKYLINIENEAKRATLAECLAIQVGKFILAIPDPTKIRKLHQI